MLLLVLHKILSILCDVCSSAPILMAYSLPSVLHITSLSLCLEPCTIVHYLTWWSKMKKTGRFVLATEKKCVPHAHHCLCPTATVADGVLCCSERERSLAWPAQAREGAYGVMDTTLWPETSGCTEGRLSCAGRA